MTLSAKLTSTSPNWSLCLVTFQDTVEDSSFAKLAPNFKPNLANPANVGSIPKFVANLTVRVSDLVSSSVLSTSSTVIFMVRY